MYHTKTMKTRCAQNGTMHFSGRHLFWALILGTVMTPHFGHHDDASWLGPQIPSRHKLKLLILQYFQVFGLGGGAAANF